MSHIRSIDTKPELTLRHELWHRGFRYRINDKKLPGKPDIVLPKYKTVIFIHGCFWHGHHGCRKFVLPKTNKDYWMAKISRNQERDQNVWRQLEAKGWYVLIVWGGELEKNTFNSTVDSLVSEILSNEATILEQSKKRKENRDAYLHLLKEHAEREKQLLEELSNVVQ